MTISPEQASTQASQQLPIVMACDQRFAMPLATTASSVLKNLHPDWTLDLHVIDGGIGEKRKTKIRQALQRMNRPFHLHFHPWPEDKIDDRLKPGRKAVYLRLYMGEVLSHQLKRVIYLDSDLLVLDDLSRLIDHPKDPTVALAAVQSFGASYVSDEWGVERWEAEGLAANTPCLNSGVMVVEMAQWREKEIGAKARDYVCQHNPRVIDQEALNAVLAGKWEPVDPRWNVMDLLFLQLIKPSNDHARLLLNRQEELTQKPSIVHFTSHRKPWKKGCVHPRAEDFINTCWQTGWFGPLTRILWKLGLIKNLLKHA